MKKREKAPKEKPVKPTKVKPEKTPKKSAKWIDLYSRENGREMKWVSCSNCGYIISKSLSEGLDKCPICGYTILKESV